MRFLFDPKQEKMAWWQAIHVKRGSLSAYFAEFDEPYVLDGLRKLEYRWTKCIELKGDYIDK